MARDVLLPMWVPILNRGGSLPTSEQSLLRPTDRPILPFVALTTWAVGWFGGQLLSAAILAGAGYARATEAPLPLLLTSTMLMWMCLLMSMSQTSRRFGGGRFRTDYGLQTRAVDVAGVGIGVICQLVLLPIVYLPLEAAWPATFGEERVRQNASDLAERSGGASMLLLVFVLVIGAPVVEELVYRGLVQRSLATRLTAPVAVASTATLFTLIHFRPVEYPGLAAFAVVLGVATAVTDRIGPSIAIHVGFNATGLLVVLA